MLHHPIAPITLLRSSKPGEPIQTLALAEWWLATLTAMNNSMVSFSANLCIMSRWAELRQSLLCLRPIGSYSRQSGTESSLFMTLARAHTIQLKLSMNARKPPSKQVSTSMHTLQQRQGGAWSKGWPNRSTYKLIRLYPPSLSEPRRAWLNYPETSSVSQVAL